MEKTAKTIKINYVRPRFHLRIFANLIDFILFVLVLSGMFLTVRAIVQATPDYQSKANRIIEIREDSGLYHVEDGESVDIVSYLNDTDFGAYAKMDASTKAIETFIVYLGNEVSSDASNTVQEDFDAYRLEATLDSKHYYIENEDGEIVINLDSGIGYAYYYSNVLSVFIDERCQAYLVTLIPEYLDLTKYEAMILYAIEVPIAYLISGILVYLVPPLFFKRGRRTLGKALYQIGLADSRLLSCTLPRYLVRWAIFFFGILTLSLVTLGIPAIISFTTMAFTKNKQGFADYILGLNEVDISKDKLYFSREEILLSGVGSEKKPVDFKNRYED